MMMESCCLGNLAMKNGGNLLPPWMHLLGLQVQHKCLHKISKRFLFLHYNLEFSQKGRNGENPLDQMFRQFWVLHTLSMWLSFKNECQFMSTFYVVPHPTSWLYYSIFPSLHFCFLNESHIYFFLLLCVTLWIPFFFSTCQLSKRKQKCQWIYFSAFL